MLAKLKFYNAWTQWYLLVSPCRVIFSCGHTSIFLISLMYPRVRVHGLPYRYNEIFDGFVLAYEFNIVDETPRIFSEIKSILWCETAS